MTSKLSARATSLVREIVVSRNLVLYTSDKVSLAMGGFNYVQGRSLRAGNVLTDRFVEDHLMIWHRTEKWDDFYEQ
jgi:capsid protein